MKNSPSESKNIISKAQERYNQLDNKNFDWFSFYNGFLEGCLFNSPAKKLKEEVEEQIKELMELTGETREDILNNIIGRIQSKNK